MKKPHDIGLLDPVAYAAHELRRFTVFCPLVRDPGVPDVEMEFGHTNVVCVHIREYQRLGHTRESGDVKRLGMGHIYYGVFEESDMPIIRLFDTHQINGQLACYFAANLWAKYDLFEKDGITAKHVSKKHLKQMQETYLRNRDDPFGSKARAELFGG